MEDNNSFSVLDMVKTYANENEVDASELFKKNPSSVTIDSEKLDNPSTSTSDKKGWMPKAELLEGMDELKHNPVVYTKDEYKESEPEELRNIADDNAIESSRMTMDEMSRKFANIEDAKKRFGIKKLQIPEGVFHVKIHSAAIDTNYSRSKKALDLIFDDIVKNFPEFIKEWEDSHKQKDLTNQGAMIDDVPENTVRKDDIDETEHDDVDENTDSNKSDELKIIIDKTNVSSISWTEEELKKMKKARSIELNIVEDVNLKYTNIDDMDDNAIDAVLSKYQRKANDVVAPLPASKFRATFTGLTYAELIDLNYALEISDLDTERKKWSIAFDHIKNPSIGPWVEYKYYIDPDTKNKVVLPIDAQNPENVKVTSVSKFDDFLMKCSYLDIDYILYKILCASSMDKEILTIECHKKDKNGNPCNNNYDWIYSPEDLLVADSIQPVVLEEMKKTVDANSAEDIKNNYMESMLNVNNTIELPVSKFGVVFGHISAYDYLNSVYGEIVALREKDMIMPSQLDNFMMLGIVKSLLLPSENNRFIRVKGVKNILKVLNTLSGPDYQTIKELIPLMLRPYQFKYELRDTRCPKCNNKTNIVINRMIELLLTVTRSLLNVDVKLKKA